jgi:flavin reductase (DIM6/NTAB) family NADH-FMN oxidoreductase RutF
METFKEITPEQITDNVFKLVGKEWMLITAGNSDGFNTMTASWGGFGVLWKKNICFCVIRPQRHTFKFIEENQTFSLNFFENKYLDALLYCGSHSGKDVDKITNSGLTPVLDGTPYFQQARLVIECKKIYFQDLIPENFLDPQISDNYPAKDYHRMYINKIIKYLSK